ncbi:MAG: class I SAM-dependent methyltransferase [Bacillota bacterium]
MTDNQLSFGSFRDPSGFIFQRDGVILRQVNHSYRDNYLLLLDSGLYKSLTENNKLIAHSETDHEGLIPDRCYKVIRPEPLPFISYPYEWSFSQLKDAALLTLDIQKKALDYGMSLKDCSAYNIQFRKGRPIFIDTLSFEKHLEGRPWVAYRQFCQHFLAPLALMSYKDVRLSQLLRIHLDGIPLDLASALLPPVTRFKFSLLTHIHLHAKAQDRYSGQKVNPGRTISANAFMGILDSLKTLIESLKWSASNTQWDNYYEQTNYSQAAFADKESNVSEMLDQLRPQTVWDLGANTGLYSMIAAGKGAKVISFDLDPAAVELNYLHCKKNNISNIQPILLDLSNPSPACGWENRERMSLIQRGPADTVLALALIHHLAISNNLPFKAIARFLSNTGSSLIIEFIPKEDSQVQRLLLNREDIFTEYNQAAFESAFSQYFALRRSALIKDSKRTLYLMERLD